MMKPILSRVLLICSLCIMLTNARAQYVAIPDTAFGSFLNIFYPACLTGSSATVWQLDTICAAVDSGYVLIEIEGTDIKDITGIQYFKKIIRLNIDQTGITVTPALPPSLTELGIFESSLFTTLGPLPDSLHILYCNYDSMLVNLPALTSPFLVFANLSYNQLTSLPPLSSSLQLLDCNNNLLTSLPTLPASLVNLNCSYNPLTSLPMLPGSLEGLICSYDQLTSLPSLPPSLESLDCSYNLLTVLPTLSVSLEGLYCSHNQLTYLPPLPTNLIYLNCHHNPAISCLPYIYRDTMQELYIDSTNIGCIPDSFIALSYDIKPDSLPICASSSPCFSTGVALVSALSSIQLYPNPNKGSFTLQTTNNIASNYTITDMMGNIIAQQSIQSNTEPIDLSDAAEGVYALMVKGMQPVRFVIMR